MRALTRCAAAAALFAPGMALAAGAPHTSGLPWWGWALVLFVTAFLMGIVAVVGGIGGGVLFVPLVGGFFPLHLDFVRGAGLMLALCGALASGPGLLRSGLASLRLAIPIALAGSVGGIVGALVGLALPTRVVQVALGVTVLLIEHDVRLVLNVCDRVLVLDYGERIAGGAPPEGQRQPKGRGAHPRAPGVAVDRPKALPLRCH